MLSTRVAGQGATLIMCNDHEKLMQEARTASEAARKSIWQCRLSVATIAREIRLRRPIDSLSSSSCLRR
jgi:hypothetical protein